MLFAALTGVILWQSSLIGGWVENWSVYHRVPQGITDSPLAERFGRRRVADYVVRNIGGWGTNVSLGFMLGITPALGHIFGVPLDVRHVTLSTGAFALSTAALGYDWFREGLFLRALAGIGTMFVLYLGVSFFCRCSPLFALTILPGLKSWSCCAASFSGSCGVPAISYCRLVLLPGSPVTPMDERGPSPVTWALW